MSKITTSLKVDEKLWKELKKKCIDLDYQIGQGLDEAVKLWLKQKGVKDV